MAITSVSVRQPIEGLILSNTARAGATGFLKTLALEIARDGVTVNSVQPGSHDTERLQSMHGGDLTAAARAVPTGKVGRAEDFGRVVAFLCSEHALHHRCVRAGRRRRPPGAPVVLRHVVVFQLEGRRPRRRGRDRRRAAHPAGPDPRAPGVPRRRRRGLVPGNHDFAVVADVDDVDGWVTYRDHPAHRRVIDELITPVLETRAAVQYVIAGPLTVEALRLGGAGG